MINNYIKHEYRPSHLVFTHPDTHHHLYLGDVAAAMDLEFLAQSGITTVVTAAAGLEQVNYTSEIKHIVYPLLDAKTEQISRFFEAFYDLTEQELKHTNVLVHCAAGISRSATLILAYIMRRKIWSFKYSIQYLRKIRPVVCPNLSFERQLKLFETHLKIEPRHTIDPEDYHGSHFRELYGTPNQGTRNRPPLTHHKYRRKNRVETRKPMSSSMRCDVLPEIANLGSTQLRPIFMDPPQIRVLEAPVKRGLSTGSNKATIYEQSNSPKLFAALPRHNHRSSSHHNSKISEIVFNSSKVAPSDFASLHQMIVTRVRLNEKKLSGERIPKSRIAPKISLWRPDQ